MRGDRSRPKVVLYNPRAVFFTMPLASIALGSRLGKHYDVVVVDGRLERDPAARLREACRDALCLGVSVLTGAPLRDALKQSRAIKAELPQLPVVWGGWHPSLFPKETLEEPSVDVTVQGQGEETFAEIVERLAAGCDVAQLANVGGCTVRTPDGVASASRPLAALDTLPAHDYRLIDVERYFALKRQRQLDFVTSVGCPFRCAFCADPFVYRRRWSGLAAERVANELDTLWRALRFDEVAFQDETFFTYPARVLEIAEGLLRRGTHFRWTGTLRADQGTRLDDSDLELCVRSGLRQVMVGVESGDPEQLAWMQKDATVEQVLVTAERCARLGVGAIFNFIVGFPGETPEILERTLALVKRLRALSPAFETPIFFFKPYPGSAITREVLESGFPLPRTLEEWAAFDFVGETNPWVDPSTSRLVERFRFYNRFAGGPENWRRWPLQKLARWRCRRDFYALPAEKLLVEWLKPLPRLS